MNKQNWVNMGCTPTDLAIIMKEEYVFTFLAEVEHPCRSIY